jgi:alkylation response protein AidB-like acyl-CoA dehydrogenase
MFEVDYDEQQRSYAQAISAFCADHAQAWTDPAAAAGIPAAFWAGLGDLGALGLTAPDSGAQPLDIVAAHEALGAGGAPGPLWQTALVAGALEGDDLDGVGSGRLVATVGSAAQMPWADRADLVFDASELGPEGGSLWRCESVHIGYEFVLLGHERAARVEFTRGAALVVTGQGSALAELALAAYLVGAGRRVMTDVVRYVRSRKQFRRVLAQFQAVAHPLAECDTRIAAAGALVRRAASRFATRPEGATGVRLDAGVALASAARASRQAVYQAHQAYGGIGYAEEGPLAWIGSRIGQLSTEAHARWRARPLDELLTTL